MNTKSAILMAAAAATAANAYTISADQSKQLDIIFKDVMANLMDYMNLVADPSSGITADNLPAGLMDLGAAMATDPNYVPDYSQVDIDAVSTFITKLTWFDSKLEPELEAAGVPMVAPATTAQPATSAPAPATTAAPAETTAAETTPAADATTPAATTPAATEAQTTAAAQNTASAEASAAASVEASASASAAASAATSAAAETTTAAPAAGVETKFITSTRLYHNTTVITSCPPESSATVEITAENTSTVTETVCDEACHSRKAAEKTSTVTAEKTSTVTATVCDEACHSKKAAASSSAAAKKTASTVAQVTKAKTSSKPVIEQQTENGAIKAAAGMGAGVLAAAALLI